MSCLSNTQKWFLVKLAQRAFNLAGAQARGCGRGRETMANISPGDISRAVTSAATLQESLAALAASGTAAAFELWRHEQVKLACGKDGLRLCDQLDYKTVEAHFLNLLNEPGKALNSHLRADSEERRQGEYNLVKACERWGFRLSYAETICRGQFKCGLPEANPEQLYNLLCTVNNRGAKKARKLQTA